MVVVQAQARIDFILNNHIDFDRKNYMDIPIPLSAYGMRRWKWLALGGAGAAAIPIVFFAVKTKDAQGIDDCDPYHLKAQISDDAEDKGFLAYLSKLLIDFGKISEKSSAAKEHDRLDEDTTHRLGLFKRRAHVTTEFPPAAVLAEEHSPAVKRLRGKAETAFGRLLPSRFTDAELMRYAVHHGYLKARDDAHAEKALSHAADAVVSSVDWFRKYTFASEDELKRFSHLLWWECSQDDRPSLTTKSSELISRSGSVAKDGSNPNHPVLHIKLGQAVHECKGIDAIAFADAIVSQVERGTRELCSDDPSRGYDRVDVIIDASGASTFAASRVARVLRSVVSVLSRHYPGRLHELTLLDLPRVLDWILRGATKIVHAETARKVHSLTTEEWEAYLKAKQRNGP